MYPDTCFRLFSIAIFICISCVHRHNFGLYDDQLVCMWNNHKKLISQIFHYQAQGTIICTLHDQKKVHFRFICTRNNNNYYIKLFNVFGLFIVSISVENGVVYIVSDIIHQNDDFKNEMKKWFIDINYFLKQLQQWIIGLPGRNVEYHLNSIGCLHYIHYVYNNKNIFIYYRHYHTNSILILPKVLEAYCDQHHVKLIINNWNIQ